MGSQGEFAFPTFPHFPAKRTPKFTVLDWGGIAQIFLDNLFLYMLIDKFKGKQREIKMVLGIAFFIFQSRSERDLAVALQER